MTDPATQAAGRGAWRDPPGGSARGLIGFAHALRTGGIRVGSAALLDATAALSAVGPERREDVRAALRTTLICDPAGLDLFDLLFEFFYPGGAPAAMGLPVSNHSQADGAPRPAERRFAETLASRGEARDIEAAGRMDTEAGGTHSGLERLKTKDFEQMSVAELDAVKRLIPKLVQAQAHRRSRCCRAAASARRIDLRGMLRHRNLDQPRYRKPASKPRDAVLLIDISGSMSVYSRLFLHFAHALSRCPGRVETFLFATRLSRITRTLRIAEPDVAIAAAARAAPDWDGGTRLGACLAEFNVLWARRVLAGGARIILLSDGLERDAIDLLEQQAARLARAAYELIWINPLLRSSAYAPLAAGAQVLARHTDALKPAHNLASLTELASLLD